MKSHAFYWRYLFQLLLVVYCVTLNSFDSIFIGRIWTAPDSGARETLDSCLQVAKCEHALDTRAPCLRANQPLCISVNLIL